MTQQNTWLKLDNAAKIYPAFAHKSDPATFRVAVVLQREVIAESLDRALQKTIKAFPAMALTLRRGLFWAYLDEHQSKPKIQEETKMPCTYINLHKSNGYLFQVYYYKKRIALECFHALTDGYGAFEFLKALLYHYLDDFLTVNAGTLLLDGSAEMYLSDGYKVFANQSKYRVQQVTAKHIRGTQTHLEGAFVHHGMISASDLKSIAKAYHTTITVLLTSLYMKALFQHRKKGPLVIAVPVNLRKIFSSKTLRNFSYVMNIKCDEDKPLEEMIALIHTQFKHQISPEVLQGQFSQNVSFEEQFFLRVMPNIFKSFVLKQVRTFKSKRIVTSVLTNPGIITLPDSMMPHVSHFETVLYASKPHSVNMGVCSYNDQLVITLSRCIEETDIIDDFFKRLRKLVDSELFIYTNVGE